MGTPLPLESTAKKADGGCMRRGAVVETRLRAILVNAPVVPTGPVARRHRTMARRLGKGDEKVSLGVFTWCSAAKICSLFDVLYMCIGKGRHANVIRRRWKRV